jgi:hypothetical protein
VKRTLASLVAMPHRLLLAATLVLALNCPLAGQTVRGTITDVTTQEPVAGALVLVIDGEGGFGAAAMSEESGRFEIAVPASDSVKLRVTRLGYRLVESVYVTPARLSATALRIGLQPAPVELEGVVFAAPRTRNEEGFLRRRERRFGIFLGPEELAKLKPTTTRLLLAFMPGTFFFPDATGRGVVVRPIGGSMVGGGGLEGARMDGAGFCRPTVFVDGWETEETLALDFVAPRPSIRAIEVYRDPREAPSQFRDLTRRGGCSVVVIWTKYGFGEYER